MDVLILPIVLISLFSIFLIFLNKIREQDEERLKKEIERDFIEEFSLNDQSTNNDNMDLVVKWLEEEQMKEKISKGSP
tara:strand:+ start:261 stop:494 length:234 start_codon:yes stop_codon:yes gene_type:complete